MPETVSNMASVNDSPGMPISSGSVALTLISTQVSATSKKPSRGCTSRRARRVSAHSSRPKARFTDIEPRKFQCWPSPNTSEQVSGSR